MGRAEKYSGCSVKAFVKPARHAELVSASVTAIALKAVNIFSLAQLASGQVNVFRISFI